MCTCRGKMIDVLHSLQESRVTRAAPNTSGGQQISITIMFSFDWLHSLFCHNVSTAWFNTGMFSYVQPVNNCDYCRPIVCLPLTALAVKIEENRFCCCHQVHRWKATTTTNVVLDVKFHLPQSFTFLLILWIRKVLWGW